MFSHLRVVDITLLVVSMARHRETDTSAFQHHLHAVFQRLVSPFALPAHFTPTLLLHPPLLPTSDWLCCHTGAVAMARAKNKTTWPPPVWLPGDTYYSAMFDYLRCSTQCTRQRQPTIDHNVCPVSLQRYWVLHNLEFRFGQKWVGSIASNILQPHKNIICSTITSFSK